MGFRPGQEVSCHGMTSTYLRFLLYLFFIGLWVRIKIFLDYLLLVLRNSLFFLGTFVPRDSFPQEGTTLRTPSYSRHFARRIEDGGRSESEGRGYVCRK